MKQINTLLTLLVFASLIIFMSCGKKDDDGGKTDKEIAIDALVNQKWTIDATNSTTEASGVTIADIAIDFTGSSPVAFTLTGGNIDTNVSGSGTLEVGDTGALTNVTMTASSTAEVVVASATGGLSDNNTTFTLTFKTENAPSRTSGLGNFKLVFKAS